MTEPQPQSYASAITELESILERIESTEVDVDRLAEEVARAASLIEWCRARILRARDAVDVAASGLEEG